MLLAQTNPDPGFRDQEPSKKQEITDFCFIGAEL
jgi:hypothetical protein